MNYTRIALLVGAIVVVVGGYLMYSAMSDTPPSDVSVGEAVTPTTTTSTSTQSNGQSGTFATLVASKQNLTCTFEHNDGTNVSAGTVYFTSSASRLRGDFTVAQSGAAPMEAHMVRDAGYNYLWGPALPQGMKMKVSLQEEGKLLSTQGGGIDENTNFTCSPWSVDSAKFSLPSDITFVEVGSQ